MHFIVVGNISFQPEAGTPYHLTKAFAQYVPTVYISPPRGWIAEWRMRRNGSPSLQVMTPLLPGGFRFIPRRSRQRWIQIASRLTLFAQIRHLREEPTVVWSFINPIGLELKRFLRQSILCYHRVDDFTAMDATYRELENKFFERSDHVFVVASTLVRSEYATKTSLLRNGVLFDLFAQTWRCSAPLPPDLAVIPAPRIGFIGSLNPDWVDTDLLYALSERHPKWSFVLIGPKVKWSPREPLPANMHRLGAKPYHELPEYLRGLDVCLIPFKDNAITRGASPLKLYEYLSAGRAVVSVPFNDAEDLPEAVVWWTQGMDGFERAIAEALQTADDPQATHRRAEVARCHTWDARAQSALHHLQERFGIEWGCSLLAND